MWASVRRGIGRVPGVRRAYESALRTRFALDLRVARVRDRWWRPSGTCSKARLNVILLSFARPRNIQPIADSVLRCDFVERLVISNNDPTVRLEQYLRIDSPRVTVVHTKAACPPVRRFEIARELPGEYFLALDDDVLLRAQQLERVFHALVADPSAPHGVIGQVKLGDADFTAPASYYLLERSAAQVDVLNRAYFFTAAQRDRFFELLVAIDRLTPERRPLRYGDDIVLSFTGRCRPHIHDVGRVLYFPSGNDPTVARWLQPGFHAYRSAIYRDLVMLSGTGSRTADVLSL